MNTIEQAAKRLEQLRRAGIDVTVNEVPAAPASSPAPIAPTPASPPQRIDFPPPESGIPLSAIPAVGDDAPDMPSEQAPAKSAAQDLPLTTMANTSGSAGAPSYAVHVGPQSKTLDIDLLRMSRAGLLVPGSPRSQLEEEFRRIKRPLLENVRSQTSVRPHRANLIMVTSALPGEGKTQTAINLAVSIALELDHSVLLVEADVIRPTTLTRLGLTARRGLIDLLENPAITLPDVLIRTNIPKLTLLPAGPSSGRATELLASSGMDLLLEELASKYTDRVIIFDSPPLLLTSEARVLASHMGQVIMVVESDKTPVNSVKQAFATLEDHPVVMSVLNKFKGPKGDAYGYYTP
jgi:protein-tyrosine kinase